MSIFSRMLTKLNTNLQFEERFNKSKFRFFHTLEHVEYICNLIEKEPNIDEYEQNILFHVAFYHDFFYIPGCHINELESAKAFKEDYFMVETEYKFSAKNNSVRISNDDAHITHDIIIMTKHNYNPKDLSSYKFEFPDKEYNDRLEKLSKIFNKLDYAIVYDISRLFKYENQIQKEFQLYSLPDYIKGRNEFIETIPPNNTNYLACKQLYNDFTKNKVYNVAIFPGSFSLMHEGHLDIITKASVIFDKVIIVGMNNPAKPENHTTGFPTIITNHFETRRSKKMVHEFVEELSNEYKANNILHNITVIKGLRNSTDFDFEYSQMKWIQELSKKSIPYMYIPANPSLGHVSSSAIKAIRQFNPDYKEYILQ